MPIVRAEKLGPLLGGGQHQFQTIESPGRILVSLEDLAEQCTDDPSVVPEPLFVKSHRSLGQVIALRRTQAISQQLAIALRDLVRTLQGAREFFQVIPSVVADRGGSDRFESHVKGIFETGLVIRRRHRQRELLTNGSTPGLMTTERRGLSAIAIP